MDDLMIINDFQDYIVDLFYDPELIEEDSEQLEEDPEQIEDDPEQIEEDLEQIEEELEQIEEDPEQIEGAPEQISNDNVDNIVNELGEIKDVLRNLENDRVSGDPVDDVNLHVSSNEIVSDNSIINVPLINYSVSESLLLMIFLSILFAGMVYVMKRSLYKWN